MPLDLHSPVDLLRWIARNTRRLVVTLVGFAVLGAGLAMLVLPGPGVLIIVTAAAINLMGDWLQERFDARSVAR